MTKDKRNVLSDGIYSFSDWNRKIELVPELFRRELL
jgi:hypothetical protein